MGYFTTPFEVSALDWDVAERSNTLFVLMNTLILGIKAPTVGPAGGIYRGDALRLDLESHGRKIDSEQEIIQSLPSGDLLVTGKDKILRKYRHPEEPLAKVDLKSRTAPNPPVEELDGHDLPSTCITRSAKFNTVVTGAEDGTVMIRNGTTLEPLQAPIKSQGHKSRGVSAILASDVGNFVVAAGFDGSLVIWTREAYNPKSGYNKREKTAFSFKAIESKGDSL